MTRVCLNHPNVHLDQSTQCWKCWREKFKQAQAELFAANTKADEIADKTIKAFERYAEQLAAANKRIEELKKEVKR